jgi:hypothetical protein
MISIRTEGKDNHRIGREIYYIISLRQTQKSHFSGRLVGRLASHLMTQKGLRDSFVWLHCCPQLPQSDAKSIPGEQGARLNSK